MLDELACIVLRKKNDDKLIKMGQILNKSRADERLDVYESATLSASQHYIAQPLEPWKIKCAFIFQRTKYMLVWMSLFFCRNRWINGHAHKALKWHDFYNRKTFDMLIY